MSAEPIAPLSPGAEKRHNRGYATNNFVWQLCAGAIAVAVGVTVFLLDAHRRHPHSGAATTSEYEILRTEIGELRADIRQLVRLHSRGQTSINQTTMEEGPTDE